MPWRDAPPVSAWQQADPVEQPKQETSRLGAALSGFGQGISLGFADEAASGLAATVKRPFSNKSWRELYEEQLQIERGNLGAAREEFPVTTMAGEVAGGVTAGLGASMQGATLLGRARTVPGAIASGAAEGAAYGGLYGVGTGETAEERLMQGATGAATGAVLGGALGGVTGAYAARGQPRIPEVGQLREQAQAAYKAAENAGVIIDENSFQRFAGNLAVKMQGKLVPKLHKDATAAFREITNQKGPVTLERADQLRQIVLDATQAKKPRDQRLANVMLRELDNYIDSITPRDVVSGDPAQATQILRTARDLWKRKSKGEIIENLLERAETRSSQFSGSGLENAIRTEFRQLAMNKNRMRQFNSAERDAIKRVVQGGPFENFMRLIGKAAPTGIVSATLGGGAGYAAGGPLGAAVVMGTGGAARSAATAATQRNARLVSEMARSGATLPSLPINRAITGGALAGAQPIIRQEDNQ